MITDDHLLGLYNIGFTRLIPYNDKIPEQTPSIEWKPISKDPNYWNKQKLLEELWRFKNVATIFGETHILNGKNETLYLNCIDIDSEGVLNILREILEAAKLKTFVTKSRKPYGYHLYWFSHQPNDPIFAKDIIKKGFEFEIKTDGRAGTMHLPNSAHRKDPNFHYTNVGQWCIMVDDTLYGILREKLKPYYNLTPKTQNRKLGSGSAKSQKNVDTSTFKNLSDEEIEDLVGCFESCWKEGHRNAIVIALSGTLFKSEKSLESAQRVIENICDNYNNGDKAKALDTLQRTYDRGAAAGEEEEIQGIGSLYAAIVNAYIAYNVTNNPTKSATKLIKDISSILRDNDVLQKGLATVISEVDEARLVQVKLSDEDIEFVFATMAMEAPYDRISLKQIFYGMMTGFTKLPTSHVIDSKDSGAGKSYDLNHVCKFLPQQYIFPFTYLSDKAIFHQQGTLVIEDELTGEVEPITPIINKLKNKISKIEAKIENEKSMAKEEDRKPDKNLISECESEISELRGEIASVMRNSQKLIDLTYKIILILDTARSEFYNAIMSLISQDVVGRDVQYGFTQKSGTGQQGTQINRLRGTPVIFSTEVVEDTRNPRYSERNRRFIHINPNTTTPKIESANDLISQRHGYSRQEYDSQIVREQAIEKAKEIIKTIIAKLKYHSKDLRPKESGVKVPFALTIGRSIGNTRVWDMTVTDRAMRYLSIISKVHMDRRPKYINVETGETLIISTFDDLREMMLLMHHGASVLRPYQATWYNQVFLPRFRQENNIPKQDIVNDKPVAVEKVAGVTTKDLVIATAKETGEQLSGTDMLYKYLYPLYNQSIINKDPSEINKNENIWSPVNPDRDAMSFPVKFEDSIPKLIIRNPAIYPTEQFLIESFEILQKHGIENNPYKIIDVDGVTELTSAQLVSKYFNNPENYFVKAYPEYNCGLVNIPERKKLPENMQIAVICNRTFYPNYVNSLLEHVCNFGIIFMVS